MGVSNALVCLKKGTKNETVGPSFGWIMFGVKRTSFLSLSFLLNHSCASACCQCE